MDYIEIIIKDYIRSRWQINVDIDKNTDLKNYGLDSLDLVYLLCLVEQKLYIKTDKIFYYNEICTIENMKKVIFSLVCCNYEKKG
jgi:acyl carrier protein